MERRGAAPGPIPVSVRLTTAEGDPFGQVAVLTVQSSAYANAARILVRGSLVALALAVGVHGLRRARRRRRAQHPPADQGSVQQGAEVTHG